MEPGARGGMRWRREFKRVRVFAVGPRGWGEGARETQTCAQDRGMPPENVWRRLSLTVRRHCTCPSGRAALGWQRDDVNHFSRKLPARRLRYRLWSGDDGSTGKCLPREIRMCFSVAPERRIPLPDALRYYRLPQHATKPRKRWSTLHTPPIYHPCQHRARGV